jgi:hypothetical protein
MPQVRRCRPSRWMLSRLISQARSGSGAADEAAVAHQILVREAEPVLHGPTTNVISATESRQIPR